MKSKSSDRQWIQLAYYNLPKSTIACFISFFSVQIGIEFCVLRVLIGRNERRIWIIQIGHQDLMDGINF